MSLQSNMQEIDEDGDTFFDSVDWSDKALPPIVAQSASAVVDYMQSQAGLQTLPDRIDQFQDDAHKILDNALAPEKIKSLSDAYDTYSDAKKESASLLEDAKGLFDIHVGSVIKKTKRNLMQGSSLQKLGSALSFVGRSWEGISIFWNELVEKKPILQILDSTIVKPMAISLYAAILPELAVVKSCEFVGRSIGAVSQGKGWKGIANVATNMLKSTSNHFQRVFGVGSNKELVAKVDGLAIPDSAKNIIKSVLKYDKIAESLGSLGENKGVDELTCGIVIAAKVSGMKVEEVLELSSPLITKIKAIPEDTRTLAATASGSIIAFARANKMDLVESINLADKIMDVVKDHPKPELAMATIGAAVMGRDSGMSVDDAIVASKHLLDIIKDSKNPEAAAAVMAGAIVAAKETGMDLQKSTEVATKMLNGEYANAAKVNINKLCEDANSKLATDLKEIYGTSAGLLPSAPKSLKEVVDEISKSAIGDDKKQNLIKVISAHVVSETVGAVVKPVVAATEAAVAPVAKKQSFLKRLFGKKEEQAETQSKSV